MKKRDQLLSFIVVALMLVAASISVHKSLFGSRLDAVAPAEKECAPSQQALETIEDDTIVIHTASLPGVIDGYAGPVPLDIKIVDGRIAGVTTLPNSETPGFLKRASKVLDSWIGKTPEEAMKMKVDAVSGATYSSNALIKNTEIGVAYYLGTADKHSAPLSPWKVWIAFVVTLAACIVPLFVKNKAYHIVQMIANIVVLGFWCGTFLDYAIILKSISSGISLPIGLTLIVMLIAAFIFPLSGRPQHYCNHICPLGSAQMLVGQICGYKIKISKPVLKGLDRFRRLLWGTLMLLLWADCLTEWMDLELFQAFQIQSASWWIIGAALLFVLLSSIVSRPYCRFVCPTGSLFKRAENIG